MSRSTAGAHLPRPMPPYAQDSRVRCGPDDDPTLFPDRPSKAARTAAAALCRPCPLRGACLAHAIAVDERHGNYAGFTPAQRRLIASGRMTVTL